MINLQLASYQRQAALQEDILNFEEWQQMPEDDGFVSIKIALAVSKISRVTPRPEFQPSEPKPFVPIDMDALEAQVLIDLAKGWFIW